MKAFVCLFCALMSFVLALPAAWADEHEPLVLDVIKLNFNTKIKGRLSNDVRDHEFGALEMNADLVDNKIKRFNVKASLAGQGDIYDYTAELNDLRGKSIKLKVQGFSLGELKGLQMNADGEGVLRFTPRSSLLGKGVPTSVDLTLKRVGAQKTWVVIYQNRVLQGASFDIDKDPTQMSTFSLLTSTPKIVKMNTNFLECDGDSVASALIDYEAPELLKLAKCDFKNLTADDTKDIVKSLAWKTSVYESVYLKAGSASYPQERMKWALQALKTLGLDLSQFSSAQLAAKDGSYLDLFALLVDAGQEEVLKELLAMGLKPMTNAALESAVQNLYQYDAKTHKLVTSALGKRIYDLLQAEMPQARPRAANVLNAFLSYSGGGTVIGYWRDQSDISAFPEYTKQLIRTMAEKGFDFKSTETSYNAYTCTNLLQERIAGAQGYQTFFTQDQGQELLNLLKSAGEK